MKKILFIVGCLLLFVMLVSPVIAMETPVTSCAGESDGTLCDDDVTDCWWGHCLNDVCNQNQEYAASGIYCGSAPYGECDAQDTCDGTGTCVDNHADDGTECEDLNLDDCYNAVCMDGACAQESSYYENSDYKCEGDSNSGPCDADSLEYCSGTDATCADVFAPTGTECTDSVKDCYDAVCDADGFCVQALTGYYESETTSCSGTSTGGPCDDNSLDHCSGTDATCQDGFIVAGTPCTDENEYDCKAAQCNGNSGSCIQESANLPKDTPCGIAPGEYSCRYQNTCNDSGECNQVHNKAAGDECYTGGGEGCSVPGCDGNGSCNPFYAPLAQGTACGDPDPNGDCDNADICDGSGHCAPNYKADGTNCKGPDDGLGGSVRDCDDAQCNGAGTCDYDHAFEPAGSYCGPSPVASCDAQDTCDAAGDCVSNFKPAGTLCQGALGPCDQADYCTGFSSSCTDLKSEAECRPAAGACDLPEFCDGDGNYCPFDDLKPAGTSCRASTGSCDPAEVCTGAAACPDDITYCVADGTLMPVRTSCQNYVDGVTPVPMYDAFSYQVRGRPSAISTISPTTIFYYVTVKGSDLPVTVKQWNTRGWKPMLMQQGKLYDADCNKLVSTTSTNTDPYSVTINRAGLDPDATYYIGIMYASDNLKGTLMPVRLSNVYFWQAFNVGDSGDSIPVIPKVA